MAHFKRPEHVAIVRALGLLKSDLFLRSQDASVLYRMRPRHAGHRGRWPFAPARHRQERGAYGADIWSKLRWVVSHLLGHRAELANAATALQMDPRTAEMAILALRQVAWPGNPAHKPDDGPFDDRRRLP